MKQSNKIAQNIEQKASLKPQSQSLNYVEKKYNQEGKHDKDINQILKKEGSAITIQKPNLQIPKKSSQASTSLSATDKPRVIKKTPQAYWITIIPQQSKKFKLNELKNNQNTKSLKNSQNSSENLTPSSYNEKIAMILKSITQQYATFRFYDLSQQKQLITKDKITQIQIRMQQELNKYNLTKRSLVFAILLPIFGSQNEKNHNLNINTTVLRHDIQNSKFYTKMINFYQRNSPMELPINQRIKQLDVESPPQSPSKLYNKSSSNDSKSLSPPKELSGNKSSRIRLSRKSSIIMGHQVFINVNGSNDDILKQLIRQMKLDFIWLGILARIGTDVDKFQQQIVESQEFIPEFIGFYQNFFNQLNLLIKQHKQSTTSENSQIKGVNKIPLLKFLQIAEQKCIIRNQQISASTQQIIRSKFNSRILISDIVYTGDYLKLLLSRNYFNLLYIQANTLIRYKNFKQNQCQNNKHKWQYLNEIISSSLENFLIIDDYWYRRFVIKCLPRVKFIIDRGNQQTPYSQVISKNYRHIIPSYRPTFDEYFISICNVLKQRSGCLKQAVGSIIVQNKRIIATGYNGTPLDSLNCFNGGCKVCNNSEKMYTQVLSCTCIHAEYGCILEAGIKVTPGSTLYSTKFPCLWCCKLIIQGRIKKIVYSKSQYPHLEYENIALARAILQEAKIQLVQMDQSKVQISTI